MKKKFKSANAIGTLAVNNKKIKNVELYEGKGGNKQKEDTRHREKRSQR